MLPSSFIAELRMLLAREVHRAFNIELEQIPVEIPPRPAFGDLAFPIGFELAKRLKARTGAKTNPRVLVEQIRQGLGDIPGVNKIEVAGAGYLNLHLDRVALVRKVRVPAPQSADDINETGKVIVEHTSINPNKAAHIGHLRNAVLGDTLVRLLRSRGERVEVHNYIDNTGVQVADVVVGFQSLEQMTLEDIRKLPGKFDYYCWDLYARVGEFYRQSPANEALRGRALREIEAGDNSTAEMAEEISMRILNCHLDTMQRLGIRYDLLPRESEIYHLKFWDRAFELLKQSGAVVYENEGKNRGCWLMRADGGSEESEGEADGSLDEEPAKHDQDKILVRSDGTVMYTGKDIAYHLWKLGRLGVDFYYRPFRNYQDGRAAWITTQSPNASSGVLPPKFGNGSYYLSVIGSEQSYLQGFVKQGLVAITHDPRVERSAHVAYEKVALTPAAIAELGIELGEDEAARRQIGMSGRRGIGVKVDDLIDRMEARALEEVVGRHADRPAERQRQIAHQIAVSALRYFLLKFTRTTAIVFDFKEALAFEGETGPYLQYSVVRADSIFRKLKEAGLDKSAIASVPDERLAELLTGEVGDDWWALLYLSCRLESVIDEACANHEPAILAKFAYQLARAFNPFYHQYRIISEPDASRRSLLTLILREVRDQLVHALELLGIEIPECM